MLVLARTEGEVIHIGEDIQITVVRIGADKVKLGVTAPKDVPVHRREVYLAIRAAEQPQSTDAAPAAPSVDPAA